MIIVLMVAHERDAEHVQRNEICVNELLSKVDELFFAEGYYGCRKGV